MQLTRPHIIKMSFILVGAIFILQLFFIQVVNNEYKLAAQKNIIQGIEEVPFRGLIYDGTGQILVYNSPVYDLMVIPQAVKNLDTLAFCSTFGISTTEFLQNLAKAKQYSYVRPSLFLKDISHPELASIQERLLDYPGFYVKACTVRQYASTILPHTLGYVAEISAARLAADTLQQYRKGDLLGINGLEAQYESFLRGKRGITYKIIDAKGREQGSFQGGKLDIAPIPGKSIYTTINRELQQYAEKLMERKVGSIVAIEPATGAIIVLASSPGYDPNVLATKNRASYFSKLEKDSLAPLFHRPIMATYAPGSIFKVVQALIALQEDVVTPQTLFSCNKQILKCRDHPSPTNLHQAIQYSCNPYFYHVFRQIINQRASKNIYEDTRIGLTKWLAYVQKFGLGSPLGIDLPHEKGGFLPSPAFYDRHYGSHQWKTSTIRSLDIGQGEMLATPLQMANLVAILANRGYYYTPYLVKSIGHDPIPATKHEVAIDKKYFEWVALAMRDAIEQGSGRRSRVANIAIAGKTGTVQNPHGEDHAVFMGFAPFETPQIALVVYVENAGWGGRAAAAIAGLLLEKYLTGKVTRSYMEEYVLRGDFS
jgi:penicillin-binding protein 2